VETPQAESVRLECDVAVIGGSMGGVAAALAALERGCTVVLTEATDWLGGQMTSQGVSALDEHPHIEQFGATRRYAELRNRIRQTYQERYGVGPYTPDGKTPLNPGNGWVSHLCFEPKVGVEVVGEMLKPYLATGQLRVLYRHEPVRASVHDDAAKEVTLRGPKAREVHLQARYFLDATDLGDLLPLTDTVYVSGAEAQADTGEPHARQGANVEEVQGFTYSFAVEFRPGENHRVAKPEGYEAFRDAQPYSFTLEAHSGQPKTYPMFAGKLPFWRYRRIFDADLLGDASQPNDVALINWASNDFHAANLIDKPEAERRRIEAAAKRLSLGFLYWLQTEAPRDEGGFGYPELKLRKDVMGTEDGLSKAPYIRESRRIVALEPVLEQDITPSLERGARAKPFPNSVGIGWYPIDLHPCVGNPLASRYAPTLPFQIPLGALIPKFTKNLLAACKNVGTTHLTNGAYRLHPTEWAIGEAAGALAAFCYRNACTPHQVWRGEGLTRRFQRDLLHAGIPLAWTTDVPPDHPLFVSLQRLVLAGALTPQSPRFEQLELEPATPLSDLERSAAALACQTLVGDAATATFDTLAALANYLSTKERA